MWTDLVGIYRVLVIILRGSVVLVESRFIVEFGSKGLILSNKSLLDGFGGSIETLCVLESCLHPIEFLCLGTSGSLLIFKGDFFYPLNSSCSLILSRGLKRLSLETDSLYFIKGWGVFEINLKGELGDLTFVTIKS